MYKQDSKQLCKLPLPLYTYYTIQCTHMSQHNLLLTYIIYILYYTLQSSQCLERLSGPALPASTSAESGRACTRGTAVYTP